jgi:predicted DNA-binding transcriptional regulator YafY
LKAQLERSLKLIMAVTANREISVEELIRQTGIPRRSIYRWISALETILPITLEKSVVKLKKF